MKEDDEEHRRSHQFSAKSADIRQFYVFYLYHITSLFFIISLFFLQNLVFRIRNFLHQLGKEPRYADAGNDVEQQSGIDVAMTTDRNENLTGNRMTHEEGG